MVKKMVTTVLAGAMGASAGVLDIRELVERDSEPCGKISQVEAGDSSWQTAAPLWAGSSHNISAELRGAMTREGLLFQVIVRGRVQTNEFHGKNLWRGDAVYLSLDARGDTPTGPDEAGLSPESDDVVFFCGLGTKGAETHWVKRSPGPGASAGNVAQSIVRDEKATVYSIEIPWTELSSAQGQSSVIGLALCVAHKDDEGQDLNWGRIVSEEDPRQLHSIALSLGAEDFATIAPKRVRLEEEPTAEIVVAIQAVEGGRITAQIGESSAAVDVPKGGVHRFLISIPAEMISPTNYQVSIQIDSAAFQEQQVFDLATPSVRVDQLKERIETLIASADHPLVVQHLESTWAVVSAALLRLEVEKASHPKRTRELMDHVEVLLEKLPSDALVWSDLNERGLPMVFTFVSEQDRTLQFYTLQFPYGWEPEKAYPLTVYLHGYGNPNPLDFLTTAFDNSHQDTLFTEDRMDPENIPPAHRGFILAPWARGNSFYQGAGEEDVWLAMAELFSSFSIDRDRVYLSGFSMGSHGVWALATRMPELWAGVNPTSGFGAWSDTRLEFLDENLTGIPIVNWIGALDSMVKDAEAFHQRLLEKGLDSQLERVPNTPHTYPYEAFQKNIGKLMQSTRKPLIEFSYVADTEKHVGRNGVLMKVDAPLDIQALPRFSCRLEDQTIHLESENTKGIELSPAALGLSGEVVVIWNGKRAYKGEDATIAIGEKLKSSFWRWIRPF